MKSLYNKQYCESNHMCYDDDAWWFITGIMKEPDEKYFAVPHLFWWEKKNISCFSHTVCLSVVKLGCKVYADHCHFIWSIFISLLSFTHVCLNTHTHTHTHTHKYRCHILLYVCVCLRFCGGCGGERVLNCLEADLLEVVKTTSLLTSGCCIRQQIIFWKSHFPCNKNSILPS